jgi:hypothetical protein
MLNFAHHSVEHSSTSNSFYIVAGLITVSLIVVIIVRSTK